MRICTFDRRQIGLVVDESVLDLSASAAARGQDLRLDDLLVLRGDELRDVVDQLAGAALPIALSDVELTSPIQRPSKIMAAPVNYSDHQAEMLQHYDVSGLGLFLKAPSSIIGHRGVVQLPYTDRRFDQEGELAVVIGTGGRDITEADARKHVFGYTCLLDMTMRGGEDRSTRKSFDTFTPIGPWIVTDDELDPSDLSLICTVNGEVRQQTRTSDLIWGVEKLVAYASSVMSLYPGDVLTTGTPAGVGSVVDGDEVSVTIERIGTLTVSVSDAGAGLSPTRGSEHGPVAPER